MLSSDANRRWLYKMVTGTAKVYSSRWLYCKTREDKTLLRISTWGWLVILSNGLDAPGISRMNHFTAEIVSLVKQISLVESSLDGHTLMIFFFIFWVTVRQTHSILKTAWYHYPPHHNNTTSATARTHYSYLNTTLTYYSVAIFPPSSKVARKYICAC